MSHHPRLIPIPLGMVKAFLILGERQILVDTGMRTHVSRIQAAMAQHDVAPQDLALILITHAHADHVGGLAALHAQSGAPVAVHALEAPALREETGRARRTGFLRRLFSPRTTPEQEQRGGIEPAVLIEQQLDLAPYGVQGRALSTPGHTPGSVSVLLSGGQAIVGDLIFGGFFGRGRPRRHFLASSPERMDESVRALLATKAKEFHLSHGGPFAAEAVRKAFEQDT